MKTISRKRYKPAALWMVFLTAFVFVFSACGKDDPDINQENEDFYTAMKEWYLWTDQIPNINPSSYPSIFEVLEAVRYQEMDRWSFIEDWDTFIAYISDAEFVGYGIGFMWDNEGILRVNLIYNNVPLYEKGVRRGWILDAVNGTTLSPSADVGALLGANQPGISNSFRFINPDGEVVNITEEKQVLSVNPVLHHEVIELEGMKVGYLVLQNFTQNATEQIEEIFTEFQAQGVDELILDMRYNGGGLTSVALQLASLIAGPAIAGEPFAKYYYNDNLQDRNRIELFTAAENSLALPRLVAITTGSTASASEMVINGLKPFIDVHVVGTDTYGKPVGADILQFNNIWAMVPITINIKNANDEGEYFSGLPADIPANDGITYDFGDTREASLQQALAFLQAGITKGEPVAAPLYRQPWEDMRGIQRWIGAY
ncbi:MAG: S41 family peptidase [Bacteroidota bacterium]